MNPYEDMRIFAQVMEAGSFTAAAERLGLSKQFVSRRVVQLEGRLGVRLVNRTTRSMSLTAEGELYFAHAARIKEKKNKVEK